MKHILDSSFRYKSSFDTDVRKTFDRIRREQKQRDEQAAAKAESKVVTMDKKKAHGG